MYDKPIFIPSKKKAEEENSSVVGHKLIEIIMVYCKETIGVRLVDNSDLHCAMQIFGTVFCLQI